MPSSPDIDRNDYLVWVRASVLQHFQSKIANAAGSNIPEVKTIWIESTTVDDIIVDMSATFKDLTKVEKRIRVDLNLIIRTLQNADEFKTEKFQGYVLTAVAPSIPVYRYGPEGNQSYFDCLQLMSNEIVFTDYGQESAGQRLNISSCRTNYQLDFTV